MRYTNTNNVRGEIKHAVRIQEAHHITWCSLKLVERRLVVSMHIVPHRHVHAIAHRFKIRNRRRLFHVDGGHLDDVWRDERRDGRRHSNPVVEGLVHGHQGVRGPHSDDAMLNSARLGAGYVAEEVYVFILPTLARERVERLRSGAHDVRCLQHVVVGVVPLEGLGLRVAGIVFDLPPTDIVVWLKNVGSSTGCPFVLAHCEAHVHDRVGRSLQPTSPENIVK